MNKSYSEILEVLKEKLGDTEDAISNFAYEDYDKDSLELGEIEEIHQEGGEGQGDHWESVKHFKDHGIYIKVVGFYSSYNGTDFCGGWESCCSQVTPKEKTITIYS